MPADMYDIFAKAHVVVQLCGTSGKISADSALWAKRMLHSKLNTYAYDATLLEGQYQAVAGDVPSPSTASCNELAMMSEEFKQTIQAYNALVEKNSQALATQIENSRPVNTYCNTIGTQTFCNSY